MIGLARMEVLFDASAGAGIPLPPALAEVYGRLSVPSPGDRPHVISNYVQSLDGVVTLDSGRSSGGPISGHNKEDRLVMGILRSVADAVIVGAGTLRSVPRHVWTADYIYPELSGEFAELRRALGKEEQPLNVIVTGSGELDSGFAVLNQAEAPVLVLTTAEGARKVPQTPAKAEVIVLPGGRGISPQDVIAAAARGRPGGILLLEAGPNLLGQFLGERLVDELFLTIAPQIAGRDDAERRPGLVAGRTFAPDDPLWANLASARRAGDHLFLRYALPSRRGQARPHPGGVGRMIDAGQES